ncbi:MAG: GlsB/YeaQ/YmgE family stress response membrane protein [Sandaracinaceae bacterium]
MGLLVWLVLGLVAGALGKFLMPGKDGGGWLVTIGLGIVGAMVGGYVGSLFGLGSVTGLNPTSVGLATGGAVLVLFAYRMIKGKN